MSDLIIWIVFTVAVPLMALVAFLAVVLGRRYGWVAGAVCVIVGATVMRAAMHYALGYPL